MSWGTCYSGSNNIHFDYPPIMDDGRNYAKWQPAAVINDEMRKIWFGNVKPGTNRYEVIKQFQYRAFIDGNEERDTNFWGDFEAVARSNFIIVYYKHGIPSWGTPAEAVLAFFLNIPIYVISDIARSEMNSSLLWWVLSTNGDVYRSTNECIKAIKDKYKLSKSEKK